MHFKSKSAVIAEALTDWRDRGLVDGPTAARLQADLQNGKRRMTFTGFIVTAGVICLCFAAMTFVAANWEYMPRLARLALVVAALWLSWGAALWAGWRGLQWWHETFLLLACGIFGAGIMLVSQIFHIQGNAADAVWLWAIGSLLAAVLTRGTMPLGLSIGLFALWHGMQFDWSSSIPDPNLPFLGWWLAGAALAWWHQSRFAAHLSVWSLSFWLLSTLPLLVEPRLAMTYLGAFTFLVIAGLLASASGKRFLRGFEGAALGYAALMLGLVVFGLTLNLSDGMYRDEALPLVPVWARMGPWLMLLPVAGLALAGQRRNWALRYDLWVTCIAGVLFLLVFGLTHLPLLSETALLALCIWITRMGWRLDLRNLRALGMTGFVLALLMIYGITVGTLISTSLFYFGAGAILLAGAWAATRLDPARKTKAGGTPT